MATIGLSKIQEVPKKIVYSDVNVDIGEITNYPLKYNELAIAQALEAIWDTPRKSRPFRRKFGSGIPYLIFDPMSRVTALKIEQDMKNQVAMWEPRIVDFQATVLPDYSNQCYYVEVSYRITGLDSEVTYNFNIMNNGG